MLFAAQYIVVPISFLLNDIVSVLFTSKSDPFGCETGVVGTILLSNPYQVMFASGLQPYTEQLNIIVVFSSTSTLLNGDNMAVDTGTIKDIKNLKETKNSNTYYTRVCVKFYGEFFCALCVLSNTSL